MQLRRIRVLLVDNDASSLSLTQSAIATTHPEWMLTATPDLQAAFPLIGDNAYNVVVTGFQSLTQDVLAFLGELKTHHPELIRIAVSNFQDAISSAKAINIFHQLFLSPLDLREMCNAIESTVALQDQHIDEQSIAMLGSIDVLPSPPATLIELNKALTDANASIETAARIIATDPAMSAKLLQLVNSAFFGLSHRVTDVHHAISYLGFSTVANLLSAVELVRAFRSVDPILTTAVNGIHAHSLAVANLAKSLMENHHSSHDAFAAGMLHDVGLLAVIANQPDKFLVLQQELAINSYSAEEVEQQILGGSHTHLGAYLLQLWGLPQSLVEAVRYSHKCDKYGHTLSPKHAVFVAEQVTNVLSPVAWEQARMPESDYLVQLGMDEQVTSLVGRSTRSN